ncbi:MAG: PilZ domain-containing protein [Lachnospiraceae bacterium]|nr:PilZ domain-containing protein [Lachnospiraceae bacterium]
MDEKRRKRRSELEDKFTLKLVSKAEKGQDPEIEIVVTDVSETGVGFHCEKELLIGDCYMGKITLWTKQTVDVFLKIVRMNKREDGTFDYGSIFFGLEDRESMRIKIYQMLEDRDKKEE